MNSGSASIDRHEETQAPHWMQAIDWVMSIIDSGGTTYSRSGGSPSGSSHGVTRRIFAQWVDSMSVTRSLITGMFPIGSTTIGRAASSARSGAARSVAPSAVGALVGLADLGLAAERRLAVDLHPARAADRRPARAADDERPVLAVADLEQPVEHREVWIEVDVELLPVRALAGLRLVPPHLERVLRHVLPP